MQETGKRPRPPHLKVFLQQNRLEKCNFNLTIMRIAEKLIKSSCSDNNRNVENELLRKYKLSITNE